MSDNYQVYDSASNLKLFRSTDLGGAHHPHHIMETLESGVPTPVSSSDPLPVSGPLTDTELRATPVDVAGPLTDTELRATPVDVAGPLTDTELRATPVPVSGTITTGGLTDSELRSSPVDVMFDPSYSSAFGTLEMGELTPVFQTDFVYGINSQTGVKIEANSGTVTTSSGRLALTCGTNSAGSAIYRSRRPCKYRAGQGMMARFTPVYAAPVDDNVQLFGPSTADDGYLVGYSDPGTGYEFGIMHRNNSGSDTWIKRADWNGDKCDGNGASGFNWTPQSGYGVPIMVKWPFLGYGNIFFYVQNPDTGRWILFHTIKYAHTSASIQLSNPNLYFWSENTNSGNTTTKTCYCGSVGIFLSGQRSYTSLPKRGTDQTVTIIDTTERAIMHIKNATSYNGIANQSLIRLQSLSMAARNATDQIVTLRFRIGATWGVTPPTTFAIIDGDGTTADNGTTITSGNTIASKSTQNSTTPTGGYVIYNLVIATGGESVIDLTPFDLFIAPGEILSVSGVATGAVSFCGLGLNWSDDI